MPYEMKSMLELMNEALAKTKSEYQSVEHFIKDSRKKRNAIKSQKFIDDLMRKNTTAHFPGKLSLVYHYPQERARHIAVSFLFGMVLSEFCGFYKSLPDILNRGQEDDNTKAGLAQRMWLITSLSHDNGYALRTELEDTKLDLQMEYPVFLLTDNYSDPSMESIKNFSHDYKHVLAHEYAHILAYNNYIRKHKAWDPPEEKNDHGILGGVEKFNDLAPKMCSLPEENRNKELPLVKACCLTVAQHNIFKSRGFDKDSGIDYDDLYRNFGLNHLLSTAGFRITNDTPLLLFLSLVDTIECMKRFSKGATKGTYLQAPTILEKIMMYVDESKVILDFSALKAHIDNREKGIKDDDRELLPIYNKHLNAIKDFHTWTVFKAVSDPTNDDIITITLDK